jgi:hypothetical protein
MRSFVVKQKRSLSTKTPKRACRPDEGAIAHTASTRRRKMVLAEERPMNSKPATPPRRDRKALVSSGANNANSIVAMR